MEFSSEVLSVAGSSRLGEALLRSVDDSLLAPGEIVREAIYDQIGAKYQVKREEIPEKLETFHKATQALLGERAASVIGKIIARNLYAQLSLNFREHVNWALTDYVDDAKKKLGEGLR